MLSVLQTNFYRFFQFVNIRVFARGNYYQILLQNLSRADHIFAWRAVNFVAHINNAIFIYAEVI